MQAHTRNLQGSSDKVCVSKQTTWSRQVGHLLCAHCIRLLRKSRKMSCVFFKCRPIARRPSRLGPVSPVRALVSLHLYQSLLNKCRRRRGALVAMRALKRETFLYVLQKTCPRIVFLCKISVRLSPALQPCAKKQNKVVRLACVSGCLFKSQVCAVSQEAASNFSYVSPLN